MHPAASIIFFTTASGLGYGLMAWAGILAAFGQMPLHRGLGIGVMVTALVLVSTGLLSSLLHLGRPERAWRALSQWRSSWLSREAVAAILTFIPATVFAGAWIFLDHLSRLAGVFTTLGALITVYCTAMIYRSLTPIKQWSNPTTVPVYLALSLMTGAAWLHAFLLAFGAGSARTVLITGAVAVISIPAGYTLKRRAWHSDPTPAATIQSATGLGGTDIRSVEWPHTEENFLLKEMGYRVARKHAERLRQIATGAGFIAPLLLLVATAGRQDWLATAAAILAAIVMAAGITVERWLFFAEAKHTVALYYGR